MGPGQSSTQRPPRSSAFFVGKNSRGNWVAQDQDGLRGGLFVNQNEAVRYAVLANIHHPQDVIFVSETLELDMTARESQSSVVTLKSRHSPPLQPAQLPSSFDDAQTEFPRKVANAR